MSTTLGRPTPWDQVAVASAGGSAWQRRRLSTTTKSVREIAHLTGYGNEASFSKAFSRMFGRPPGQYRQERLAAPQLAVK